MTVDKRINYEMQGGSKPARNYLGAQKTVSGVPVKWKSGPDHPETELAYITKAEKDLLVKKDLHGSLKNGPNTGPDGIMSLNDQGDYTRDFSPAGKAPGRSPQQSNWMNEKIQEAHDQKTKDFYTGNLSPDDPRMHSTSAPGPRTRQYSDLPEWMEVKQPDGTYKRKHMASAYKSYGQPSFFGNLFSRGAPGYRGIKGLPAWGDPMKNYQLRGIKDPITGEITPNQEGEMGYYTDKENFGETREAVPFGIMGILNSIANKFRKPRDMSEFNKLSLTKPEDQKAYIPEGMDSPMASLALAQYRTPGTLGAIPKADTFRKNTMFDDLMNYDEHSTMGNMDAPGPWNNFNKPASNLDRITGGAYNLDDMLMDKPSGPPGQTMSPDYRATQFEDMERYNPSMTEKEWLDRQQDEMSGRASTGNTLSDMIVPIGMNADQKAKALKEIEWGVAPEIIFPKLQNIDDTKWWGGKKDTHIRPNEFIEFWEKQTGRPLSDAQKQKIFAKYT